MKIESKNPFAEFDCYKIYHKGMGRWQVCLVSKNDRKIRRTILYSKFVMSVHLGRQLLPEEEVDHVDRDKTNDELSNLEVVSREENVRRHLMVSTKKWVNLICPHCGISFIRARNQTPVYKGSTTSLSFCSRVCSGKYYGRFSNSKKI